MSEIVVREMKPGEEGAVVEILVSAFDADPLARWMFPDFAVRTETHRIIFGNAVRAPGAHVEVTDNLTAAAVWINAPNDAGEQNEPPPISTEAKKLFSLIDVAAPMPPCWILSFLGASSRGTGAGSALLNHRHSVITGKSALWTGNEKNLKFYERFGYKVVSKHEVDGAAAWWLSRS